MRILGFSKKWDKLKELEFTTFRVTRKDKDWYIGENVQIVYKPRSKEREPLGIAQINSKETKTIYEIRSPEAIADGFPNGRGEMWSWMFKAHKHLKNTNPINKLNLRWISRILKG